jgi:hypothetical protein
MTMHDADRPTGYDSVEEDDESDATWSREEDYTVDEDTDEGEDTEPEVVETDQDTEPEVVETDEDTEPELVETDQDTEPEVVETDEDTEPELVETDEAYEPDRTPGSDARDKLAPVGPDSAVDPGTGSYEDRWGAIQAGFIDDPGRTVESASALLAEISDDITRAITGEREGIDDRWRTTESSTDDLRVAMQDYRALYGRLTSFPPGG